MIHRSLIGVLAFLALATALPARGDTLALGPSHTCVLSPKQQPLCWGRLLETAPGQTSPSWVVSEKPRPVALPAPATALAAGRAHTCALLSDGGIACWGDNNKGQLGGGSLGGNAITPVAVEAHEKAESLAAGGDTTCAGFVDGTVACWGDNTHLLLGGEGDSGPEPMAIRAATSALDLAMGARHACAVMGLDYKADTEAFSKKVVGCWGDPGKVMDQPGLDSPYVPKVLNDFKDPLAVAVLTGKACAAHGGGAVGCWSREGGLTITGGLTGVVDLTGGDQHLCALKTDRSALCWGGNGAGQVGNMSTDTQATPVTPLGLKNVIAIAAGPRNTCAVLGDGSVLCWGDNSHKQVGTTGPGPQKRPLLVLPPSSAWVPKLSP